MPTGNCQLSHMHNTTFTFLMGQKTGETGGKHKCNAYIYVQRGTDRYMSVQ